MRSLSRNIALFHVYYLFRSAAFQRGVFLIFLQHKGFEGVELGTLQATLYLANFAAEVPTGLLGDKLGRRWSMLAGLLLTAVTTAAQIWLGGLSTFVVIFALQGIGLAFLSGSDAALLYDSMKALGRSAGYVELKARVGFIAAATLAASMAVGGWLESVSWTAVYGATVAATLIATVSVALMREAPLHEEAAPTSSGARAQAPSGVLAALRAFASDPSGRALVPLVLASGLLHAVITPYFVFSQALFESQGAAITVIAVVIALVQLAAGAFGLVAGRVAQRASLRLTFFVTVLGLIGCCLLNLADRAVVSVALFALAMIGPEVLVILIDNHLQERLPSRARASILSAFSLVEACFTGLTYVGMGALLGAVRPAVAIAALSSVLLVALALGAIYFAPSAVRWGGARAARQ